MYLSRNDFLLQFSQRVLDAKTALFLGAGGTIDAGYPSWKELFMPIAKELGKSIEDIDDYYKLAQYYSNHSDDNELRIRIVERLNQYHNKSPLLDELMDIGFSDIWTTNFDNAVEMNYSKRNVLINKVFKDDDISSTHLDDRINLFKLNGDVSNPAGMVATQADYEKYNDTHRLMLMFFKRSLISNAFLFIGYSFKDHLVLDCLSEIRNYLGRAATTHYAIIKREPDNPYFDLFIEDLEKRYGVRALVVDDYHEITIVLNDLNTRIRDKKVFVSGAFNAYEPQIEEFSHLLSKELSKSLLENDYRIVNGIGRRFGTHLIGYASEFLAKSGKKRIEKNLIITPFVDNSEKSAVEKCEKRKLVIHSCGAAIFVFGDLDNNSVEYKSGVMEEFAIAREQHKTIIPIRYPGYVSETIWNIVKDNLTEFPYLEGCLEHLQYDQSISKICNTVNHILESVRDSR